MTFKEKLHNFKERTRIFVIRYSYIFAPLIGIIMYFIILKNKTLDSNFNSNVINISGNLAGFMFTSLGIMVSLPDNKFTTYIKGNGYMNIIYKTMSLGIITFLISMIMGLFNINKSVMTIFFIIGISETFLSAYYLYRVSHFTNKSI